MTNFVRTQDWEYAEEMIPGDINSWETIDIQIDTEAEALKRAQAHANITGHRVSVTTSIRIVDPATNSVEDRDIVPGDPAPLILEPQKES